MGFYPVISCDYTPEQSMAADNTASTDIQSLFRPKSLFTPMGSNPSLIAFCKKVDFDVQKFFDTRSKPIQKSNLSITEFNALKELTNMNNIIIRPADKGGAVVVLSKEMYIQEATRQLDTKHYERICTNPLSELTNAFHNILTHANNSNWITESEMRYMTVEYPALATFYLLPKVHKPPFDNPPGRPIISGNGTLTEPASKFVDFFSSNPLLRLSPLLLRILLMS